MYGSTENESNQVINKNKFKYGSTGNETNQVINKYK